jgi:hypothetical protein
VITLFGSAANSVMPLPRVVDDALAQQGEAGPPVYLPFDHLKSRVTLPSMALEL